MYKVIKSRFLLVFFFSFSLIVISQTTQVGSASYTNSHPGTDAAGRNNFPSGSPQLSGNAIGKPVPTNDWWSKLIKEDHADNLFNYPMTMKTTNTGLIVTMFKNKVLLITGGTGSFGNAVLRRFLDTDITEIRIFSRDEKKQDDMRKQYNHPKLRFYIGDVRDYQSVSNAMRGVDYVYHAAALKQVPSCEFYPLEAVKTNVIGTENVLEAAILHGVERVVCLSTDKAVYPINAMGISKAMMEKVIVAKSRNLQSTNTTICCTRYGNVMASRGSVIPLFIRQAVNGDPITITDPLAIEANISATTDVSCNGGDNGSATVNASGGAGTFNYLWSDDNAQTTATASNLTAGLYTVIVNIILLNLKLYSIVHY